MRWIPIVLVAAMVCLIACNISKGGQNNSSDNYTNTEPEQQLPDIYGKWLWVKTDCCGRMHKIITDTSETPTYLVLEKDGKLKRLHGDKTLKVATYNYQMDPNLGYPTLSVSGVSQPGLIHFVGDTMLLDYGYFDLQTEYYIKTK